MSYLVKKDLSLFKTVRFFDYDGTVLSTQYIMPGGSAIAPESPSHDRLTFSEWNNDFTNVQKNIDVGAIYNTISGNTELDIVVNSVTGLLVTLNLTKTDASLMTIDWGDTTSSTSSVFDNLSFSHTYSTDGSYTVKISASATFYLGSGTSATKLISSSSYQLVNAFFGNFSNFNNYSFYQTYSLSKMSIRPGAVGIGDNTFNSCRKLWCVALPSSVTSIGASAFQNCFSLTTLTIPSSVTSIGANAFQNCFPLTEYHFIGSTPPTLEDATVFTGIIGICKIYVPAASVAAYKAATYWSSYVDYIYGE